MPPIPVKKELQNSFLLLLPSLHPIHTSTLVDLSSFSSLIWAVLLLMSRVDGLSLVSAGGGGDGASWCRMASSALSASFTCSRALNRFCSLLTSPVSLLPLLPTLCDERRKVELY